ncbi:hypothetical protein [Microbacterium enclense]|uniref:hypothetical protein n=1 Tax=Microbacterium enclense TaxID=993073 RepID=UPI00342CEC4F
MSESIPDRVFIVTSGEYSSYGISSVWSTREAAEKAAAGWGEVEEWLLNTTHDREIVEWRAWIDQRDESIRVSDRPVHTNSIGHTHVGRTRPLPPIYGGSSPRTAKWAGEGYGPTPEHARKALSDALAKAMAEELELGESP